MISGDIKGVFYLGSMLKFRNSSSVINVKILPVVQSGNDSNDIDKLANTGFETKTSSGDIIVIVVDPIRYLSTFLTN
jgi:hypothetical protein